MQNQGRVNIRGNVREDVIFRIVSLISGNQFVLGDEVGRIKLAMRDVFSRSDHRSNIYTFCTDYPRISLFRGKSRIENGNGFFISNERLLSHAKVHLRSLEGCTYPEQFLFFCF